MVQGGRLSHNPLLNNAAISLSVRRKCHPGKLKNLAFSGMIFPSLKKMI